MYSTQIARIKSGLRHVPLLILLACSRLTLGQQDTSSVPIEDLLNVQEFAASTPIAFSPDGKWIVYTTRGSARHDTNNPFKDMQAGVPSYARDTDVWLVNAETAEATNLTKGVGDNWSPVWSPDGRYLAFFSNRDKGGQAKLWLWDAAAKTFKKASDVPIRADKLEWMPNSAKVLTTILPENSSPEQYAERILNSGNSAKDSLKAEVKGSSVVVYAGNRGQEQTKTVATSDPWSLETYRRDLALIDVQNSAVERLVRGGCISAYVVSPNGAYVAFSVPERFENPGAQQILWSLSVVKISPRAIATVAHSLHLEYDGASFSWSPDSLFVAYSTGGPSEVDDGASDGYVVAPEGGPSRNVTMFPKHGLSQTLRYKQLPPIWNPSGQMIYFIRGDSIWIASPAGNQAHKLVTIPNHRIMRFVSVENRLWSPDGGRSTIVMTDDLEQHQSGFYRVELNDGRFSALLENGQCYVCVNTEQPVAVHGVTNHLAYLSQDSKHGDDLWLADAGFASPHRLTHINPQFDKHQFGATRLIEWRSLDGESLQGALLLPSDYHVGRRYPLIVWVYGGARGSNSVNHFGLAYGAAFNMQLLATRGYAILFPDTPQHLGTPMIDLAKSVLPGVDKTIEMGIAEPSCIGVMGHSYGAYSALSLIVQTKRFRAAVIADGTGNLIGQYGQMSRDGSAFGTSITEKGQGLIGGTPWEFRDRYIENSPIFYLDRVETPVLILHGTEDTAVPPFLGDELFVDLRRLGKEVEYAKYAGEGHSPVYWSHANQLDLWARVVAWFSEHLQVVAVN